MPENTGQSEPKPEESKPEPKPSTPPEEHEGKARRFVKYQDLDKSELVSMLLRVNKRLTRVNKELREIINILYYGNTQNSGYRGKYGKKPGNYGKQKRSEGEDEEDVNYE